MGTFELVLSYLPNFSAVCVSVAMATTAGSAHSGSTHIDKSTLLSCLFEGDTGRVSPNTVVSYNIRRHGGDVFSAAVRQYGFPYKWVQSLCGISVLSAGAGGMAGGGGEGGGEWDEGTVQPQVHTSVENITVIMAALRKRFMAQVNLAKQIAKLGEWRLRISETLRILSSDHSLVCALRRLALVCTCMCVCVCFTEEGQIGKVEGEGDEMAAALPQSQLVRWKSVLLSEVQVKV